MPGPYKILKDKNNPAPYFCGAGRFLCFLFLGCGVGLAVGIVGQVVQGVQAAVDLGFQHDGQAEILLVDVVRRHPQHAGIMGVNVALVSRVVLGGRGLLPLAGESWCSAGQ